ncbi:MAG TPA: MmcQ/YjbR family DNA-binding protein [Candidatus Polarisedimenticolia bacterium]|nr:MmcQ/YjbR family DNA-binding protein [Candidatus Polarisedimenticolia bacterium]
MTPAQFRKLALALPEAEASSHMGHPDFRVGGKVFATLGYPDAGWGMAKLTPDQQDAFMAMKPEVFKPAAGAWGLRGATCVLLKDAPAGLVRDALKAAWTNTAPKSLLEPKKARR